MPFLRVQVRAVADRIVELMDNHSAYDAGYIALAEHMGSRILTLDPGLAASPVARCAFVELDECL
jgi:predicted nucleic acid-binding protein